MLVSYKGYFNPWYTRLICPLKHPNAYCFVLEKKKKAVIGRQTLYVHVQAFVISGPQRVL